MKKNRIIYIVVLGIASLLLTSCEKFFDINTDDVLLHDDSYKSTGEIYSGLLGIAALMQDAADEHIVLTELLGDLVEPTQNAPMDFWEVYRYRKSSDNQLMNPERYYKIILNSNDLLRNIVRFNKKNPNAIPETLYKGVISSTITYRAWAYLNIGKIYGEALYYDLALVDKTELDNHRVLTLDELVDELIHFMQTGVDGVDAWNKLEWSEIMGTDARDWYYMTVHPDMLMCELMLWDNNPWEAAKYALDAIYSGVDASGKPDLSKYKLVYRGISWSTMFSATYASIGNEAMTAIPYDHLYGQTHRLEYYFSPYELYYLRRNLYCNYNYDRRSDKYRMASEESIFAVGRYHEGRTVRNHDSHIFIYRAGEAWLMLAEALTGTGDFAQADSILNVGMKNSWSGSKFNPPFDAPIYRNDLQNNAGIRGRAAAAPIYLSSIVVDSLFTNESELIERKTFVMDSLILEETAHELAFEGKRWFAAMRISRNLNRPDLLANLISKKFSTLEREMYKEWLMDPKNWFVRYDQMSVSEK